MDVDIFSDPKIKWITIRFGLKGEGVLLRLLCEIYRNGYHMQFDEEEAQVVAFSVGAAGQHCFVMDVVQELLKRGFFDGSIFKRFKTLTSAGIQKRYIKATAERKHVEIISDIWLIDIPESTKGKEITIVDTDKAINRPINPINPPINSQRKVKESKVIIPPLTPPMPEPGQRPPSASGGKGKALSDSAKAELRAIRDKFVFADGLEKAVNEWVKYKYERREGYKPVGLQGMLAQIKNNAGKFGDEAMAQAIYDSIASNYKGIVWPKGQYRTNEPSQAGKKKTFADIAAEMED